MPASLFTDEILRALWTYWSAKRGEAEIPSRSDIDPVEIPRLLPHIQLVETIEPDGRFRYRLCGTAIVEAYGRDLTGRFVEEAIPQHRHAVALRHYRLVRDTAQPIFARTQYESQRGAQIIANRLILPLRNCGPRVSMLLIGQVCEFQSKVEIELGSAKAVDDYVEKIEILGA